MTHNASVVLESSAMLSEVCGVNDVNLQAMEKMLETRILSRGNELYIEDENPEKKELLVRMLGELEDHVNLGQSPTPDLVRAVFTSLTAGSDERAERLKEAHIHIAAANRSVFPRTFAQALYIDGMDAHEMVFCVGPAGTGKTYLAVAHALAEVLGKKKRKLVLTRPVVEAGEKLGFLPGDLAQKINPYLKPLYDAMESLAPQETIQKLEDNRIIEIAPLAYMRGRSLNNCYIILDEAQNTTREQMKMFLTRIGEGSRAIITGDVTQIDLPSKRESGLLHAIRILDTIEEIHFNYFTSKDVVRNPLIKKIVRAYENDET